MTIARKPSARSSGPKSGPPRMNSWLYQMSTQHWPEENYRTDVWEGEPVTFSVGRVNGAARDERPAHGDRIFCWYAETVSRAPGLCGWGVVLSLRERREVMLVWRPVFPSDLLKLRPLIDREVTSLVEVIRHGMPRGTLWLMPHSAAEALTAKVLSQVRSNVPAGASSQTTT